MLIQKGVPAPTARPRKYPFGDLEIGDCLVVDLEKRRSVTGAAKSYAQYHGKRFRIRTDPDGVKIYRIA